MIARGSVDDVVDRPDLAAVPVELHEIEGLLGKVLIEQLRGADVVVVGHRGRGGSAPWCSGRSGCSACCTRSAHSGMIVGWSIAEEHQLDLVGGARSCPA